MMIQDMIVRASSLQAEAAAESNNEKLLQAREILLALLNQVPEEPSVLFYIATNYLLSGNNGLAIALFNRAMCFDPCNPSLHCNIASAYKLEDRCSEAEKHLIIANTLNESSEYLNNLGALWVNRGFPERGIPFARQALELDSGNARAAWNLSLMELEQENFAEGFRLYTAGIDTGDRYIKRYHINGGDSLLPIWNGERGKRVVVYGEQGLGDEIMFASAIEDLLKDCEKVVFDCHPRMEGIMKRSFEPMGITVRGERKKQEIHWAEEYGLDAMVPIGNLFHQYRSDGQFPRKKYLTPNARMVKKYRKMLESLGPPPYIGISWAGGSKKTHARYRSLKLGNMEPLIDGRGTSVSLQYTDVAEKVERFNAGRPDDRKLHHFPDILKDFNYEKSIALAAACDVVVSVCQSIVHVCGAIGAPCIVMTPFERAWRYGKDEFMWQYGDWVKQVHRGESEPVDQYMARVSKAIDDHLERYR